VVKKEPKTTSAKPLKTAANDDPPWNPSNVPYIKTDFKCKRCLPPPPLAHPFSPSPSSCCCITARLVLAAPDKFVKYNSQYRTALGSHPNKANGLTFDGHAPPIDAKMLAELQTQSTAFLKKWKPIAKAHKGMLGTEKSCNQVVIATLMHGPLITGASEYVRIRSDVWTGLAILAPFHCHSRNSQNAADAL
jgi:prepilin-type processing-associated H-X9-DG protein